MLGVNIRLFLSHTEMSSIFSKLIVLGLSSVCCILGVDKFRERIGGVRRTICQGGRRVWGQAGEDDRVYQISI
jgi:hypothetical protein